MASDGRVLLLVLTACLFISVVLLPRVATSQHTCRRLKIDSCKGLNYGRTMLPNFQNHRGQRKAARVINQFIPLFKVGCSPDLKFFVCSYYAPACNTLGRLIKPCKSLCESAKRSCRTVMERFGYAWPVQLDCNKFPDNPKQEICVGLNNSGTIAPSFIQLPPKRAVANKTTKQVPVLPSSISQRGKCRRLKIDSCKGLNYSRTMFPNFQNHRGQKKAARVINQFIPLFKAGCSPDLKYFVCSYYAPACNTLGRLIKPCKSLCESAKNGCRIVMERFGYVWPSQFDCNKFPDDQKQEICIGRNSSITTLAGPNKPSPTRIVATPKQVPVLPSAISRQRKCQTLAIDSCKGLNYNRTLFPNFENHRSQEMAAQMVNHFNPLFKVSCSPDLKYFVCSYYAPVCNTLGRLIKPCRSLCESARNGCRTVMERFGYTWPVQLDCNKFPTDQKQEICVGRNNSRTTLAGPSKPFPTQIVATKTPKQVSVLPSAISQRKCQTLAIESCKGLNYSRTLFPNFENHRSQEMAAEMVNHFNPLFKVSCSPDLKYFVCSYYAPICNTLGRLIKPCRSLCESAKNGCRILMERFGYAWPLQLNCDKFPDNPKQEICVARSNS